MTAVTATLPGVVVPDRAQEFTGLYRQEFPYVWHTLRRLGIASKDLPDLTHDVFVAVYHGLDRFDRARPVRPWLFGVAFRVASDHLRLARNAREHVSDALEAPDASPGAEQRLAAQQELALVREALLSLDLERRAVLIMHDFDELPGPETAAALGVALQTMYYRLRTAREQFAAAVRRIKARRGER